MLKNWIGYLIGIMDTSSKKIFLVILVYLRFRGCSFPPPPQRNTLPQYPGRGPIFHRGAPRVRPGVTWVQLRSPGCTEVTMKSVRVHPSQPEMQNLVMVEIPALKSDWPRWNPCTFPARSVAQATSFPGALAHIYVYSWRTGASRF